MARSARPRALAAAALATFVGSCGGDTPPPVVEAEPPAPVRERAPLASRQEAPPPELCPRLATIMAREVDGYAQLRGSSVGRERWHSAAKLPGLERCTVEGETWPRARVSCSSGTSTGGSREFVLARFEAMAREIDDCLGRAFWFPRTWERGELFEFAMDERQQAWIDTSSIPPSSVVLKVQQDLISRDYLLEVNFQTIR